MSKELTEHQRKAEQATEKLNSAYRTVFVTEKPSYTALKAARKRVMQDLDDVVYQQNYRADKDGKYCPYRAAIEDGFRRMAKDIRKRISSKSMEGLGKKQPKVIK